MLRLEYVWFSREWMSWAFFECHLQELNEREAVEVEEMIQLVEVWLDEPFEEGYNPAAISVSVKSCCTNSSFMLR